MDGDGDMDVLSASINDDNIAWYENDGSESFHRTSIISISRRWCAYQFMRADVDGDGDMDVLSASVLIIAKSPGMKMMTQCKPQFYRTGRSLMNADYGATISLRQQI